MTQESIKHALVNVVSLAMPTRRLRRRFRRMLLHFRMRDLDGRVVHDARRRAAQRWQDEKRSELQSD